MLLFTDETSFSSGYATYAYHPVTQQENSPRIFLTISIEGVETQAFVDTGAPYVICKPQIARLLRLDRRSGERIQNVNLRGYYLEGTLYRLTVVLIAEMGESLPVDATVFVPELQPDQEWQDFPSILGLNSFLERIRFAVDPAQDRFYFGGLDGA